MKTLEHENIKTKELIFPPSSAEGGGESLPWSNGDRVGDLF